MFVVRSLSVFYKIKFVDFDGGVESDETVNR